MTIICYRDGCMAADSATFSGDIIVSRAEKIIRTASGGLIGTCGTSADCIAVRAWALNDFVGTKPELGDQSVSSFGATFVSADGKVFAIQKELVLLPVDFPFHADGYCRDVAFGAMAAGATAKEAVEICLKYCQGVGGPVHVWQL